MSFSVTDASGIDKVKIYFNGRLIATIRQFPMAPLTFDHRSSKGTKRALKLYATDRAGNVSKIVIYVEVI